MPSLTDIAQESSSAFTDAELERLREITGETLTDVTAKANVISAVQRQFTRADFKAWEDEVGDGQVGLKGGRDGVNYDQELERSAVRVRVRLRLGYPAYNPDLSPNAVKLVWLPTEWADRDTASEL